MQILHKRKEGTADEDVWAGKEMKKEERELNDQEEDGDAVEVCLFMCV